MTKKQRQKITKIFAIVAIASMALGSVARMILLLRG